MDIVTQQERDLFNKFFKELNQHLVKIEKNNEINSEDIRELKVEVRVLSKIINDKRLDQLNSHPINSILNFIAKHKAIASLVCFAFIAFVFESIITRFFHLFK